MSYGFVDNSSTEDEKKIKPELEQNKEEVKNTEPVSKEVNEQPVPGQKRKPEPPSKTFQESLILKARLNRILF